MICFTTTDGFSDIIRLASSLVLHLLLGPTPNFPPAVLPLDSTPQSDPFVEYEVPDNKNPALVLRQRIIKLLCNLIQLRKSCPWDSWEIMVFIMESDVVCEDIQGTVVRVRFWNGGALDVFWDRRVVDCGWVENVMFGDEVRRKWVERPGEERRHEEVDQCVEAHCLSDDRVESEFDDQIESVDAGEWVFVYHHGTQGVEEDLKGAEESFAEEGI